MKCPTPNTVTAKKIATQPMTAKPARLLASSIAVLCGIVLLPDTSMAQTWNAAPANGNWNSAANWTPANVPDVAGETAIFGASSNTTPAVGSAITIAGITFNAAAPVYTITNNTDMTIVGAGIVNSSVAIKTINTTSGHTLEFQNAATAANIVLSNTTGLSSINFADTSTAGTSTINNLSATASVNFFDTATLGAATINNSTSASFPSSNVSFFGSSTAATGIILNSGSNTQTIFSDTSTAGSSQITNSASGSSTLFNLNATAATSRITNSGTDTFIEFDNSATAGSSTLVNSGSGALIEFYNNSTAGTATVNNTSSTGIINFLDNSTAGGATVNNSGTGAFPAAVVSFFGTSNAGTATINNSGGNTQTLFSDTTSALTSHLNNTGSASSSVFIIGSTAANSLIVNSGADSFTSFAGTSTAGAATITNSGSGSLTEFYDTATAGTATLNNTHATGIINFLDSATAGAATINNSGTGAFPAAVVGFLNNSKAGTATIRNSGGNTQTFFSDTATANTANITNSGAGSSTLFLVNATAAGSTITNSGADSFTSFIGQSKAGTANITNSGSGSLTDFADTSSAGSATLTNSHPTAIINFLDSSTAANATINNDASGVFPSSLVGFFNNSTAAKATISNNGDNTQTLFSDNSTAGSAVIDNTGAGSSTLFVADATATNSTITNTGADSFIEFNGNSQAANATLKNNGTASQIRFRGTTSAGSATIINAGSGSGTIFAEGASGGSARIVNTDASSVIDISQLTTTGTTLGSIEGGGSLALGSKKLTVGSINLNTTFSGDIKDGGLGGGTGGSIVKVGTGALTLTGANSFTGGTTLQAGSILVGSSQALGNGNVTVTDGTLAATGDTRDINVKGNYTQTGGTVQFRVGGAAAGQYDRLAVTGKATVGGRLSVTSINGFKPQQDNRFFVVTAAGGVTGQFAEFDDKLSQAALKLGVTYDANNVILEVLQSTFLPFAQTPNQRAVARALDRVVNDPNAVNLLSFLDTLPAGALPGTFDRIAPEEFGAIFEISRSAAKVQALTVQHRLDEIHASEEIEMPADLGKDGKTSRSMAANDGKGGKGAKDVVAPTRRFGVWANGNGEFVTVGSTSNARGYDFSSGGFTLGMDYKFSSHFAAGVLFNYTRTDAQLTGNGSLESDAVRGGIYASVFGGGAYANAYIGGGYNDYDSRRDGLQGRPRGSTSGTEFTTFLSAGYDKKIGDLKIGPVVSYQYTTTDVDSFRERGSLAPLRIASMSGESSRTNLGARASYDWHIGSVVLVPEIRASWQHEFGDVEQTTDARFAFGGPSFSVNSARVGRDSFQLSSGFSLQITPDIAAYAFYDGELGRSNYDAHNIVGGIRANF